MIKGLFCKDSRMLVRNGQSLIEQNKFYSVHMGTLEPEAKNEKKFLSWSKLAIVLAFFAIGAVLVVANLKTASKI